MRTNTVSISVEVTAEMRDLLDDLTARRGLNSKSRLMRQLIKEEAECQGLELTETVTPRGQYMRTDDRVAQVNWLKLKVVSFIISGGCGDYDVTTMEPADLAAFMLDYWMNYADELPAWWTDADRRYCLEQLTQHFEDQRNQA